MAAVDLVVQIETPTSVASGISGWPRQPPGGRGLARHHLPEVPGRSPGERRDHEGDEGGRGRGDARPPEPARRPRPAARGDGRAGRAEGGRLSPLSRRAAPYSALGRAQFEGVLDMLSGRYPSDDFAELRPRVVWDRLRGVVRPREGTQRLVVQNAGTIPDGVSTGSSSPTAWAGRSGSASSTRRWSSRVAPARFSSSAPPAGGSPRSRATRCGSCPPRRAREDAVLEGPPGRAAGGDGPCHWPPDRAPGDHAERGDRAPAVLPRPRPPGRETSSPTSRTSARRPESCPTTA